MADWEEVVVSDSSTTRAITRASKQGQLRKLASRLYTKNFNDSAEIIIKRNLWQIVGAYFPGAIIADRTALENAPASDGSVCLVANSESDISLPGIILRPRKGLPPSTDDRPFIAGLHLSSTPRAFLENMRATRARGGRVARTLSTKELEERLDGFLRIGGESALNRLRDETRDLAISLNMQAEAKKLDDIIGALLCTKGTSLQSDLGKARSLGRPYDPTRIKLFEILEKELRDHPPIFRERLVKSEEGRTTQAFFEAYFSNFIEGTEFEVEEALNIVFRGVIPRERPDDAHDILGTYRMVVSQAQAGSDLTFENFIQVLKYCHANIMESRRDMRPGEFKLTKNRAGATFFVEPELILGTLEHGFKICRSFNSPFARAIFMMFLISEVHPFTDGNGRTARILMNAELSSANEERIIIPTVYRENYLAALRSLSRSEHPGALIRMLDYAQRWTAAINWQGIESTRNELANSNAFVDSREAEDKGIRLKLP